MTPHYILPSDYNMVDTPLPRNSEDSVVNNYGRELLALCIASRLRIINGRTRPDNIKGAFTYYMPRGASVVDYTITSDEFLNNISHFQVGDISSFSDQCPLYLQISTNSGSSFHISRLNMFPKNLLEDALERMNIHQDEMELGEEALVRLRHTSKEKLTETFSNTDFCNKVASLKAELSTLLQ